MLGGLSGEPNLADAELHLCQTHSQCGVLFDQSAGLFQLFDRLVRSTSLPEGFRVLASCFRVNGACRDGFRQQFLGLLLPAAFQGGDPPP